MKGKSWGWKSSCEATNNYLRLFMLSSEGTFPLLRAEVYIENFLTENSHNKPIGMRHGVEYDVDNFLYI